MISLKNQPLKSRLENFQNSSIRKPFRQWQRIAVRAMNQKLEYFGITLL